MGWVYLLLQHGLRPHLTIDLEAHIRSVLSEREEQRMADLSPTLEDTEL